MIIYHNKTIILLLLLLFPILAFNQEKKSKVQHEGKYSNSAPSSSKKLKYQRESAQLLIQQAEILKEKEPNLAVKKLEKALTLSLEEKDIFTEADCYRVLGTINLQSGLKESALRQLQKAYTLFRNLNEEDRLLLTRPSLANAYVANNDNSSALKYLTEQVEEAEKVGKISEQVKALNLIAELKLRVGEKDEALSQYQKILGLEKQRKNEEGIAEANKHIGEIYQSRKDNKRALEYYKEAQDIAEKGNDAKSYSEINKNISEVVPENEALDLKKKSLEKSRKSKDIDVETKENLEIGNVYLQQQKTGSAITYLERSLELSDKSGKLEEKGNALRLLSEAYKQQKQFEKAISAFEKYLAIKDTLILQKERQIRKMLSSNIGLAEQQKQIELLEKNAELNNQKIEALSHEQEAKEEKLNKQILLIYSLSIGLIMILVFSYLMYKNGRKRRIANQLLALKSLRTQMNPHFIFNALNSVNSFISKNDERSANKYLADFSKLMRMVMENSQHDFVPLSQEIHILQLYLTLEHFRFSEKFSYNFEVDEALDTDAYEVPPMLIQPYIENAVWHGLRYKSDKGILSVSFIKSKESSVSVIIEDDGIGRKKSTLLKTENQKASSSTGIKNTVSRIHLINELYNKNIKISLEDIKPDQDETGTRVTITLPAKIKKQL